MRCLRSNQRVKVRQVRTALVATTGVRAKGFGNIIATEYRLSRILDVKPPARTMTYRREAGSPSTCREGALIFLKRVLVLVWLPIGLKARLYHQLKEVRGELTP